jgi:hypothetical protein
VQEIAARKLIALHESNEAWVSWHRDRELADADETRATALVAQLEAEAAIADAKARSDRFRCRFEAQAKENAAVTDLIRSELPKAWDILSRVLEAIASAEIATEQVVGEMPDDFDPGDLWIGNPDMTVRWRPPVPEKILSTKVVELWVDPSGNPFVDQTREPTVTAHKRKFTEITYQHFAPADGVPPLYKTLRIPRLNHVGGPTLFDGSALNGPHDVLAALQRIHERVERNPVVLVKYEPLDRKAMQEPLIATIDEEETLRGRPLIAPIGDFQLLPPDARRSG